MITKKNAKPPRIAQPVDGPYIRARAIACLLSEQTVIAAAKCAGVHRNTLFTYLADPEFKTALHAAQADAVRLASARLAGALEKSVTTVIRLAESATDEPTRLRAAMAVPALLADLRNMGDIDARIAALEMAIEQKNTMQTKTVFDYSTTAAALESRPAADQNAAVAS